MMYIRVYVYISPHPFSLMSKQARHADEKNKNSFLSLSRPTYRRPTPTLFSVQRRPYDTNDAQITPSRAKITQSPSHHQINVGVAGKKRYTTRYVPRGSSPQPVQLGSLQQKGGASQHTKQNQADLPIEVLPPPPQGLFTEIEAADRHQKGTAPCQERGHAPLRPLT